MREGALGMTQNDIDLFADVSADINPAHVDLEYPEQSQFNGVITHGLWTESFISAVATSD